jgi:hypothetical protein
LLDIESSFITENTFHAIQSSWTPTDALTDPVQLDRILADSPAVDLWVKAAAIWKTPLNELEKRVSLSDKPFW